MADCPDALKADPSLPLPAKAIAGALWDIVNFQDKNPRVYRPRAKIAEDLAISRKTLDRWIVVLERAGWVTRRLNGRELQLHRESTTPPELGGNERSEGGDPTRTVPPGLSTQFSGPPQSWAGNPPRDVHETSPGLGGLSNKSNQEQSSPPSPPATKPGFPVVDPTRFPPGRPRGLGVGDQLVGEWNTYRIPKLEAELQTRLPRWRNPEAGMLLDGALEDVGGSSPKDRQARVWSVVRFTAEQVAAGDIPKVFFGSMFKGNGFAARLEAYENHAPNAKVATSDADEIAALHRDICGE